MSDESIIKQNYKDAMECIESTEEERSRITELYNNKDNIVKIQKRHNTGIPKIAVAVLVLSCVLVLGGGVVWAMNNTGLKDYFFKKSEKEFTDVYTDIGEKYELENIDIVLEGSIYDKSVEQGFLSLSFWDKEGNPFYLDETNTKYLSDSYSGLKSRFYMGDIRTFGYQAGEDKFYLLLINNGSLFSMREDNNLYVMFQRLEVEDDERYGEKVKYLILNENQFKQLNEELKKTEETSVKSSIYKIPPEVEEILNKFNPREIQYIDIPAQEITIDNLKLTVGRTCMLLEYNENTCDIRSFTMIREDGSETEFIRKAGGLWEVLGMEDKQRFGGGSGNHKNDYKVAYNFGFILGANEKVKIEVNGKTYE